MTEDVDKPGADQRRGWDWTLELGGMLGWVPDTVYRATLPELMLALRGFQRARGIDPDAASDVMTRDRLAELLRQIE